MVCSLEGSAISDEVGVRSRASFRCPAFHE
jgi:hypothetical protein